MFITESMKNISVIILLMITSTSSGNENSVTVQRINRLDKGIISFSPFVENSLAFSSGYKQNTAAGLISRKPLVRKINHDRVSPAISVLETTTTFPAKEFKKEETPPKMMPKNYSSLKTNLSETTSRINVTKNISTTQSTDDENMKWDIRTGDESKKNSYGREIKLKSSSHPIGDEDHSKIAPTPQSDSEKVSFADGPKLNANENGNKPFINIGSVQDQGESVSQRERKIEVLEEKLKSQGMGENSSLFYAISLIHQHINTSLILEEEFPLNITSVPPDIVTANERKIKQNPEMLNANILHTNHKIQLKKSPPLSANGYISSIKIHEPIIPTTRVKKPTTSTAKPPKSTSAGASSLPKSPHVPAYRSFILLLDGNCMQIRTRMNIFVKYLKGTLATKLGAEYSDIRVPSVVCDKSFVVNISFDEHKYPDAYAHLRALAASNATLLEISGHIFYLEKVLTSLPAMQFRLKDYLGGDYELHVIAFVSAICMCVFLGIAVATFYLLKCYYCRSRAQLSHREKEILHDDNSPNIIYSANFSNQLKSRDSGNNSEMIAECGRDSNARLSTGLYPFSFANDSFESFNSGNDRTFSKSPSQLRLMEEIQEDDEYLEESLRSHENSEC